MGTQNIDAMMPSVVGPTMDGGPQDGASSRADAGANSVPTVVTRRGWIMAHFSDEYHVLIETHW